MEAHINDFVKSTPPLYFAVFAIILTTLYYFFKTRSLPPGPTGLPYFGFWPFLNNNAPHLHLLELTKKYGDLFSFTVTGTLYINLGSHKVLKEAHVAKSDHFERPGSFTYLGTIFEDGIFISNGDSWKAFRKFFSQQFRERGLNSLKGEIFGQTLDETVKGTIEQLRRTKGESVELVNILTDKCCKVMHMAVFGERGVTTEEIRKFNDNYECLVQQISGRSFLLTGNIAKHLLVPLMPSFRRGDKYFTLITKQMTEIINRHKETYEEGNLRNLIDVYIKERKQRISKNDPTAKYFTDKALMSSLLQIIGDGVVSVAVFISAFFQALIKHPEEQEKIYKELVEVTGLDRNPTMEDKSKLVYTNAFISEVIRTTDSFPFFPALECTKEFTIGGYRIPKGSVTLLNGWAIHHNPNEYENPDTFNPSRFLPVEGKRKVEQPVLFGLGRRACIGEGYTVSQAFLFLTSIVKNFRLTKDDLKKDSLLFLSGTLHVRLHPRAE